MKITKEQAEELKDAMKKAFENTDYERSYNVYDVIDEMTEKPKFNYDGLFSKYDFKKGEYGIRTLRLGNYALGLALFTAIDEFKLVYEFNNGGELRFDLTFENNEEIENFIKCFKKYDL